jgi:hypothetical protein
VCQTARDSAAQHSRGSSTMACALFTSPSTARVTTTLRGEGGRTTYSCSGAVERTTSLSEVSPGKTTSNHAPHPLKVPFRLGLIATDVDILCVGSSARVVMC